MAGPTCPKCGDTSIVISPSSTAHDSEPQGQVRCATCGEAMGLMETADFSNIFRRLKKKSDPRPGDAERS